MACDILGTLQPGAKMSVPLSALKSAQELHVRPLLFQDIDDADGVSPFACLHQWSVGASNGDQSIMLQSLEDCDYRLLCCNPLVSPPDVDGYLPAQAKGARFRAQCAFGLCWSRMSMHFF